MKCKKHAVPLRLALTKHILKIIIVNRVIIFKMLQKAFSIKLGFILDSSLFFVVET